MIRPLSAGSLAIVVATDTTWGVANLGKMVMVLGPIFTGQHYGFELDESCKPRDRWIVQSVGEPLLIAASIRLLPLEVAVIPAQMLRPIYTPDADAVDESKAWLPPVPPRKRVQA